MRDSRFSHLVMFHSVMFSDSLICAVFVLVLEGHQVFIRSFS